MLKNQLQDTQNLPAAEAQVAKRLLELGFGIKDVSARTLAKQAFVAPATVVRLCQRLGFDGYPALQTAFLREQEDLMHVSSGVDFNFPFTPSDSMGQIANKIAAVHQEALNDTMEILRHDALANARQLIINASTIYLYAFGTTLNQAESFKEKMTKIGRRVIITPNLNYQLYEAGTMQPSDLAIIISYSGETREIRQLLPLCQKKGVPILALTSLGDNSLSRVSTAILHLPSKEKLRRNIADFSVHVAANLLLDILYGLVFDQDFEGNLDRKLAVSAALEPERQSTNHLLTDN